MIETSELQNKRTGMRQFKAGLPRWARHQAAPGCEQQDCER